MTKSAMTTIRVVTLALSVLILTPGASAQKAKKNATRTIAPSTALATVGSESITLGDVERAFQKNLTRRETPFVSVPRDTAMEFLRLYTNYRLKVADAKDRGVHLDSAVKVDLANNRRLLSETFFYDKAVVDKRVDQLAQRRLKELKIGIILSAIPDHVNRQWDTTGSRLKAERFIAALNSGADFEKLARDSSDDKETSKDGGMLPWISGGTIIKAVEDEAYALKPGQVSPKPVASPFGYFIVKLFREEPREQVKFRHILLQAKDGRDSMATDRFADSLLQIFAMKPAQQQAALNARRVTNTGDVFADLAQAYSDDKASAAKGGFLGSTYSRSGGMEANGQRLVPSFEDAIYQLKDGQLSTKAKTLFGTHIIIRDSTKRPDASVERDAAKRTYRRLYFEEDKRIVLDSVKNALGYRWVPEALAMFLEAIDSTKNTQDTTWARKVTPFMSDKVIYTMPRGPVTVGQFTDSLRLRIDMRGFTLNRAGLDRAINKISDPLALEQATKDLEVRYPDFASLMQEFNDGILLFKVEEKEVWSKLRFDTVDARAYYDTTRTRWMTEAKVNLTECYFMNDSLAKAIAERARKGENLGTLAAEFTQREGARDRKGTLLAQSPKSSKLAQKVTATTKVGDIIGPFPIDAGWSVIRYDGPVPPQQRSFDEALAELAPVYQDALQKRLTESWLSGVRIKHPVVYSTKVLDGIWGATKTSRSKN